VLPEPTAAALATGWTRRRTRRSSCSTSAAARSTCRCLDVGDGVFEVLSINGNTHLGGDDFDEELINYLAEEFRKQEGIDLRKDPMALQRLKEAAEKAKIELSNAMETTVNLPFITADQNGPSTCRRR
jgi:molecular chaperone DnaK